MTPEHITEDDHDSTDLAARFRPRFEVGESRRVTNTYGQSPECDRRGCVITYTRRSLTEGVYQHGDNPEAVLVVPCLMPSSPPPWKVIRAMFSEWVERVHNYEGARAPLDIRAEDHADPDDLDERGHFKPGVDASDAFRRAADAMRGQA